MRVTSGGLDDDDVAGGDMMAPVNAAPASARHNVAFMSTATTNTLPKQSSSFATIIIIINNITRGINESH